MTARKARFQRTFALLTTLALLSLTASDALTQRRGGGGGGRGGGGGGRSTSSSRTAGSSVRQSREVNKPSASQSTSRPSRSSTSGEARAAGQRATGTAGDRRATTDRRSTNTADRQANQDNRQTDRDDRQANRDFDGDNVDDLDGAVIHGEEGSAAIISGEDGVAVIGGEGGCCYGEYHDSWDAWEAFAVVGAAMAIGTIIAQPPPAATTVVYNNTTYYVKDGTYFEQVYNGGEVAYQAVAPPPGAVP